MHKDSEEKKSMVTTDTTHTFMGMEVKVEGALKSLVLCEEARECMV